MHEEKSSIILGSEHVELWTTLISIERKGRVELLRAKSSANHYGTQA